MSKRKERKIPYIMLLVAVLGAAILAILIYILPGRYRLYQTTLFDQAEEVPPNPMMGFAPDARKLKACENTGMVLINLAWKDWEPQPGKYARDYLEKTYHIRDYKKKGKYGVLRLRCQEPDNAKDGDLKKAIRALADYFSDCPFIRCIETDEVSRKYVSEFQKAFPKAFITTPPDFKKSKEKGSGIYYKHLGDTDLQKTDRNSVLLPDFWKRAPAGGSLSFTQDRKKLLKDKLSVVLQEIRDDHISYISDNCPGAKQQKKNGSRMILRTLGYCLYISRLQTTVNFRRDTVKLQFTFVNTGVAPPYTDWPVIMTIYDQSKKKAARKVLPMKLNKLLPGKEYVVSGEFPYNAKISKGFSVGLRISNPDDEKEFITLAQKTVKPDETGEHLIYSYEASGQRERIRIDHPDSYSTSMIDLLCDLSYYAKGKNEDFAMFTNGGYQLYMPEYNKNEESIMRLTSSMDGAITESVFYGWDDMDNYPTPEKESKRMRKAVRYQKDAGMTVLNIEYCSKKEIRKKSAEKCRKIGSVWYNALDRELSKIPEIAAYRKNDDDCTEPADIQNFAAVLNPVEYKTKEEYLNAIRETDYDLIFIDLYYHGKKLTRKDVSSLKTKKNGADRMICAYMSVGEAEDYRDYWEESWNEDPPPWIADVNQNWSGNYKVMYWTKPWRDILFGSKGGYLDKIIATGFDGVYLDVVDAYEYFEDLRDQ